jgi:outer membrane scaffolding protein for murein synthesis (MipA/OmpV family)
MWRLCVHRWWWVFGVAMGGVLALSVEAGDLSSDVRKGALAPNTGDGGYIEIGLGAAAYTSPIVGMPEGNEKDEIHLEPLLDINARYQYKGWFIELFSQSLEQFTLGYNFYNGDNWAVDWVGVVEHDEMSEEETDDYRGLKRRGSDFMSGNYIVQLHLLADISDTHHGELYSLKLARHWQYRNWTIHGIVGGTYRSRQIADYYFSIDESEASEKFPQYEAPAGMAYVVELGITFPISEKWVFRSLVRRIDLESSAVKSPLILDDHSEMIATSVSYVF